MDYENWTKDELIAKLRLLEGSDDSINKTTDLSLKTEAGDAALPATPRKRKGRLLEFDFSKFPQRKVAFKFSYFGWPYYGLARQGNALESAEGKQVESQYPTVEGELFKALAHCKLITSESSCGYSRCGRTDRGVSGFGQVIALYVRSAGKFVSEDEAREIEARGQQHLLTRDEFNGGCAVLLPDNEQELPYVNMLNKTLPAEIRILAWSPVAADFSARFSCKTRFYRYFFSEDGLDIEAMRAAADRYLGTHDFRNFCRLDPAKQITNFERRVLGIAITRVPAQVAFVGDGASVESRWWQLELHGTAFLWHQVRCMMAVLFAVGQGLESPDVVDRLTDVRTVNGKPEYEMASDLPLVLADCIFDAADVQWMRVRSPGRDLANMSALDRTISKSWGELSTQAVIASALLQTLRDAEIPMPNEAQKPVLDAANKPVKHEADLEPTLVPWAQCRQQLHEAEKKIVTKVILGAGAMKHAKKYTPIMQRKRAEPVEQRNQAWLERKNANKRARSNAEN
ncbi:pseudouridine synthase deg1 [Coemansia erecta]|nr:pseudouridine synthase deg1 [Coemansia sp. RSA 2618]KAJ2829454.1 pseudouridine synthase deg1 [Coemansia erecta]